MKNLSSLLVPALLLSQGCSPEPDVPARELPACRVEIPSPEQEASLGSPDDEVIVGEARPRVIVAEPADEYDRAKLEYQLFWEVSTEGDAEGPPVLYRAIRSLSGLQKEEAKPLLAGVRAWDVIAYGGGALLAARQETLGQPGEILLYRGEPSGRRLRVVGTEGASSLALAVQGQTALVVYTLPDPGGPLIFARLVDLCILGDEPTAECRAGFLPDGGFEDSILPAWWRTLEAPMGGLPAPAGVLVGRGSDISTVGFQADSFLVSYRTPDGRTEAVRVSLDPRQPPKEGDRAELPSTPGPAPLARILSSSYAFTGAAAGDQLGLSRLLPGPDGSGLLASSPRVAALGAEGRLSRFSAALGYRDGEGVDRFAALWLGRTPISSDGLVFARLSSEGELAAPPLWVLPGEELRAAAVARADDGRQLRLGVFYQHRREEVGVGFFQIVCQH